MEHRLAPGIVVMQFVTIFFPTYEIFESKAEMRITFHQIRSDESLQAASSSGDEQIKSSSGRELFEGLHATASSAGKKMSKPYIFLFLLRAFTHH